jgi:hypothetical protein
MHSYPLSHEFSISFAFELCFYLQLSSPVILGFFPFNVSLVVWTCDWLNNSQQPKSQKYICMLTELQYLIFNRFFTQNTLFPLLECHICSFSCCSHLYYFRQLFGLSTILCILEQRLYHSTVPYLLEIFLSRPTICHLIRWFSECALITIICCSAQSYFILHFNLQATM